MVAELDIWRAASLLMRQYGAAAENEAARRAGVMFDRGDRDGLFLWLRIRKAIAEWQAEPTGRLH